jgi:ABC-2 type transport system permease protein
MNAFWSLVRTDLKLYFSNRRAVLMNIAAPILIAAFFGYLFSDKKGDTAAIPIAVADLDASTISTKVVAALAAEKMLKVQALNESDGIGQVRAGKLAALVVIPAGFGSQAGTALFSARDLPVIQVHYDPSQGTALQVIRGLLAQSVMQNVSAEVFSQSSTALTDLRATIDRSTTLTTGRKTDLTIMFDSIDKVLKRPDAAGAATADADAGRPQLGLPYTVSEDEVRARDAVPYNSFSHSFAGMGVQFVLLMGIDLGIGLLTMRRLGLWRRLRAAPLSKALLLGSRVASCALTALMLMIIIYAFAMVVFGVRIDGSAVGFAGVVIAFCLLTASFGLLVAAIGKTPEATRGLAILLTLLLVMLGGAWVPSFVFPAWMQKITAFVPTRWAIDGLDAMTWRGLGLSAAIWPIVLMCAVAAACLAIAVKVFDWEE